MSIDISSMTSILNSVSNMRGVGGMTKGLSTLNARSRALNAEIRSDKARGMDTAKKEAQLAKLQESLSSLENTLGIEKKKPATAAATAEPEEEAVVDEEQKAINDFLTGLEEQNANNPFDALQSGSENASFYDLIKPNVDVKV